MNKVFYHPGKPGEVSHAAAETYVARLLRNPFTSGDLLARIASNSHQRLTGRSMIAAGSMTNYLRAAALRDLTRGEGEGR